MINPKPDRRYAVKEIFGPTIQGEATLAGTPCLFLRFSGCNMWDGRAHTRAASQCPYCDTDFFGGKMMTAVEIVSALEAIRQNVMWVWISGGEPLLQLDYPLVSRLIGAEYRVAIETNGTVPWPEKIPLYLISHLTVSPKVPWSKLAIKQASTLKLLYPHPNPEITPEAMQDFYSPNRYLQPIDPAVAETNEIDDAMIHEGVAQGYEDNLRATIAKLYELGGNWRLSLQSHKMLGLP